MVDFINENLLGQAVKGEHLAVDWDVWISFSCIVASKTLILVFDQPGSSTMK